MSKYMTFNEVVFKDRDLLIGALEDIGCKEVRRGDNLEMGRYYSDQLPQRAEIIIPRNTIGNYYGDIGFRRSENGEYTPVIDNLDQSHVLNGQFIPRLRAAYNERVVSKVASRLRGTVHRAVEGGVVKIKVRY
ncbi:MAG TPA: DUF1257 domain-containing protein [Blastocatellia bacterium]|nr:DUF1257 domain-containing protein [Blastocatellia bacterium]